MPSKETYIIHKVPLAEKPLDIPINFPRQPQLYLELIENKQRIKPLLVNKDYVPPQGIQLESPVLTPEWRPAQYYTPNPSPSTTPAASPTGSPLGSIHSSPAKSIKEQLFRTPFATKYKKEEVKAPLPPTPPPSNPQPTTSRLPTLSEIEKQHKVHRQKEFVNLDKVKYDDDNTKRELLFKLDILQKSYPKATIEKFTIHDTLPTIQDYYDSRLRMLSLERSVDNYKTYLTFLFMGVETLFGKVFKLDMKGFTEQQLMEIHKYDQLLLEIGEKSYLPSAKKWPVELRLLFLVIIQTAFFVVGKMILGGAATKILGSVTDMKAGRGMGSAPVGGGAGRRMKGPRINLSEIPDSSKK